MEQLFRVRHNAVGISSIHGFSQIKGGINNGCKDVYFMIALGTNSTYLSDILEMDKKLGMQMSNRNGFYKRIMALPNNISNENIFFYSGCYDEWIKSGKKEISIKMKSCNEPVFRNILADVCVQGEKIYRSISQNVSDSMIKNFMVKILFWLDYVFETEEYQWDAKLNSKIIAANVQKKQELLFWYLVSLLGNDVLLLQSERDIVNGVLEDKYVKKLVVGEFSSIQIPEVKKVTKEGKEEPVLQTDNSHSAKIKITIPRHEKRNHKPVSVPETVNAEPTGRNTMKKEKSYEELAQLASSVVLIAIHDSNGKVIGTGSGIMIGTDGYILTNNHVASGGRYYSVKIEDDDKVYETEEVIKYNSVLDLAVIRIQRKLKAIPVYKGPEKLVRGQRVVAIGSPLGLFNSVSDGIISGFRTIDTVDMIQFTAPTSHGSSGGAVLNMYGEVIGISTAGYDSGQNINLAVGYENINIFVNGFT